MRAVTAALRDGDLATAPLVDLAGDVGRMFVHGRRGMVGFGIAAKVALEHSVDLLRSIEHIDLRDSDARTGPGAGAVALGAIDFLPGAPNSIVIPSVLVADDGHGHRCVTIVDDGELDPQVAVTTACAGLTRCSDPTPTSAAFTVAPAVDVAHYLAAVETARDAVRDGVLEKAVIARPVVVSSDHPMSVHAVLRRLENTFGNTYRFSIDGFVGASPELLVEVDDLTVRSRPLAGTTRTTGDPDRDTRLADELMNSEKNRIEHHAAIEMVRDTLLPYCSYLDWTPRPSIVKVANVQHLGSQAEGMLSEPPSTVTELVTALQPTPAVGGHPRAAAIDLIIANEGFERGRYGGAVGWVDGNGDGVWAVSLRCAEFSDDRRSARLVAGGGIVADSDPLAELAETQAKLQAMLGALIRP